MNVVIRAKALMLALGASPILYLMLALSVVSLAVIVERAWFFFRATGNVEKLAADLERELSSGNLDGARRRFERERTAEARIVLAGLRKAEQGADAAIDAMAGEGSLQRMKLERGLAYLGTLGSNAPFIGLLGTVVGIVMAFDQLSGSGGGAAGASANVMASIAEALVATAVGLAVAIPAIVAYNYFQRRIKSILANSDVLGRVLSGWLKSDKTSIVCSEVPPSSRRPTLTLAPALRTAGKEG
ncbi:MAG: MotA/TolQ/ExbB proton channel family protein [Polyangiaceae bacterium]